MDSAHLCLVREDCRTEANRLAAELKDFCSLTSSEEIWNL